ncbi:MAG: hydrogenase/urease accessory protein HupE [Gammaproteobacteria bacterium]|jgi:hydrogenase/urease accessory protein HupE
MAVYRLPMDDMDLLLRLDKDLDETVTLQELSEASTQIDNYLTERINIQLNHQLVENEFISTNIWLDSDSFPYLELNVKYSTIATIDSADINLKFLTDLYPDHRTLAELDTQIEQLQFVFQHENTWSWQRDKTNVWTAARGFILFGLEHIFTGYDHILFLLGLLLVGKGLRNLVIIATSFTIAHSITLTIATLGIVQPIAWVVEAAIALSIVYVGVENLLAKDIKRRWILAFVFGLVHGFGFAGLLQELDLERTGLLLSLFSFNFGVELGQVIIIIITWPLLNYLSKSQYRKEVVQLSSLVITIFGLIWFVERII